MQRHTRIQDRIHISDVKNGTQKTNTKREQAQSNRIKVLNYYLSNIPTSKDRKQASINV